jgi:hypothetical protein
MNVRFKATDKQIGEISHNAVKASRPAGMGFLQPHETIPSAQELEPEDKSDANLDYVYGRMVKVYFRRLGDDTWACHGEPRSDYQSWSSAYPSYKDLVLSVPGTSIIEEAQSA